ncbi:MAG: hypothetical protein WBD07_02365 [Vicinamibacterales bacterium]
MKHLSPDEFIDLAEGARAETDLPHLSTCAKCRRQLVDLRASLSSLSGAQVGAGNDVSEPSPLFWDHFSARVREAVDAEGSPRNPPRRDRWALLGAWGQWHWSGAMPLGGAVALVAVAVALTGYVMAPAAPVPGAAAAADVVTEAASLSALGGADDPTLSLVADLSADLDFDGANEAGLTVPAHVGGANDVVSTLTDGERRELQQLLQEELARPRA